VDHLDVMTAVTKREDVLLVKRDEVAVVRRGLMRPEFVKGKGEMGEAALRAHNVGALGRRIRV
jgi:hypothetical protein